MKQRLPVSGISAQTGYSSEFLQVFNSVIFFGFWQFSPNFVAMLELEVLYDDSPCFSLSKCYKIL